MTDSEDNKNMPDLESVQTFIKDAREGKVKLLLIEPNSIDHPVKAIKLADQIERVLNTRTSPPKEVLEALDRIWESADERWIKNNVDRVKVKADYETIRKHIGGEDGN